MDDTNRVVRGQDGVYRWRTKMCRDMRLKVVKITVGVCGGLCLLILLLCLAAGAKGETLYATLLSIAGVAVVVAPICLLYYKATANSYQSYEMNEKWLRFVGTGRSNAYLDFERIRSLRVVEPQSLLDVKTALVSAPFYVPKEDFAFVLNYIRLRIPETAKVTYSSR